VVLSSTRPRPRTSVASDTPPCLNPRASPHLPPRPLIYFKRPAPRQPQSPRPALSVHKSLGAGPGPAAHRAVLGVLRGARGGHGPAALFLCGRASILCVFSADTTGQQQATAETKQASKVHYNQQRVGDFWSCLQRASSFSSCGQQRRRRRLGDGFSSRLAVQEEKRKPTRPEHQPLACRATTTVRLGHGQHGGRSPSGPAAPTKRTSRQPRCRRAPAAAHRGDADSPQPTLGDLTVMLIQIHSSSTRPWALAPGQAQPPAVQHSVT